MDIKSLQHCCKNALYQKILTVKQYVNDCYDSNFALQTNLWSILIPKVRVVEACVFQNFSWL